MMPSSVLGGKKTHMWKWSTTTIISSTTTNNSSSNNNENKIKIDIYINTN